MMVSFVNPSIFFFFRRVAMQQETISRKSLEASWDDVGWMDGEEEEGVGLSMAYCPKRRCFESFKDDVGDGTESGIWNFKSVNVIVLSWIYWSRYYFRIKGLLLIIIVIWIIVLVLLEVPRWPFFLCSVCDARKIKRKCNLLESEEGWVKRDTERERENGIEREK